VAKIAKSLQQVFHVEKLSAKDQIHSLYQQDTIIFFIFFALVAGTTGGAPSHASVPTPSLGTVFNYK
jgi:hypothetical protein